MNQADMVSVQFSFDVKFKVMLKRQSYHDPVKCIMYLCKQSSASHNSVTYQQVPTRHLLDSFEILKTILQILTLAFEDDLKMK